VSLGDRLGGIDEVELPDEFPNSTSWERAADEDEITRNRLNRAEWMVNIGDGGHHRVTFALDDGHMLAECSCEGHRYGGWCAHVAAMVRGYVNGTVEPADLSDPLDEEADRLWRERDDRRSLITEDRR